MTETWINLPLMVTAYVPVSATFRQVQADTLNEGLNNLKYIIIPKWRWKIPCYDIKVKAINSRKKKKKRHSSTKIFYALLLWTLLKLGLSFWYNNSNVTDCYTIKYGTFCFFYFIETTAGLFCPQVSPTSLCTQWLWPRFVEMDFHELAILW